MGPGLELFAWLGVAGIAFTSANILLWRARQALKPPRQDVAAREYRLIPEEAVTTTSIMVTAA